MDAYVTQIGQGNPGRRKQRRSHRGARKDTQWTIRLHKLRLHKLRLHKQGKLSDDEARRLLDAQNTSHSCCQYQ